MILEEIYLKIDPKNMYILILINLGSKLFIFDEFLKSITLLLKKNK